MIYTSLPLSLYISGMLSKSRGQVLRLAAVFNILFSMGNDETTDDISDVAVRAAINFVKITCQQTAYIAGRGLVEEDIQRFGTGNCIMYVMHVISCKIM